MLVDTINRDWELVGLHIADLDWQEVPALLEIASTMGTDTEELMTGLFRSPPLGIEPEVFGFQGCLVAADVARLREALEISESDRAEEVKDDRHLSEETEYGPATVLLSLRDVPAGKDVALRLG